MGSSTPAYSENHVINPETGFLENPAFPNQFDSDRKVQFINLTRQGIGFYTICKQLVISHDTAFRALREDNVFFEQVEKARKEYGCQLETTSKQNALNPKSVIERIFQLKAIFPEKYADNKQSGNLNITINVASVPAVDAAKVVDAEIVGNQQV